MIPWMGSLIALDCVLKWKRSSRLNRIGRHDSFRENDFVSLLAGGRDAGHATSKFVHGSRKGLERKSAEVGVKRVALFRIVEIKGRCKVVDGYSQEPIERLRCRIRLGG